MYGGCLELQRGQVCIKRKKIQKYYIIIDRGVTTTRFFVQIKYQNRHLRCEQLGGAIKDIVLVVVKE